MLRTFVSLLLLFPLLGHAEDVLHVHNWNDYIDPKVLEDFQRDTGIRVDYQTYSTSEEIAARLASDQPIDVAMPSHDLLATLIKDQRLLPLDFARLPNRKHLDPDLLAKLAAMDSGNRHALPYLWTSAGLAVNVPQAEAALNGPLPNSWSLLFDPQYSARLASCGISLLDAPKEIYSGLLSYQGHNLARTSPGRLKRASATLTALRPHLRYVDSERYIEDLNQGRLCLAVAWSGDALGAAEAGQPVQFLIPEEGAAASIDSMVIPRTAQRVDLAYRFIDYLMQPQVAARTTSVTFYPSGNAGAREFLAPNLRDNPTLYPDRDTKRRLVLLETVTPKLQAVIDDQWPRFRDAQ
ncbi:extracellular solute-binding protein [Pseudomonas sp. LS44]|uniref:extracellular solute-binding protein n=1 Tax=Pseudomonas sp. LS44 TaxID=1357074 RepID=UPI00215B588D|nr:extracellular solute-binding protein [Pseudomonas sp. LS44]UVE18020.1 extracellular solute-binding protein [Pseudomonas sp. LS44]